VKRTVARLGGSQPTVAERRLLELLVHDGELRRAVLPRIEESDYEELPTAAVFQILKELEREGAEVAFATLGERTADDPVAADLVPLLLMSEPNHGEPATDDPMADAERCLVALRLMKVDRRLKELAAEIAAAERAGDDARRDRLVMENLEWTRLRATLIPRAGAAHSG